MLDMDAFREFRHGLMLLRDGDPEGASESLRRIAQREPENPYYISYYGLSLAQSGGNWAEAERLCHTAVCRARRQTQLYLNLAEVYGAAGYRQAAVDTLARGLHYMPHDVRLQMEYGRLMTRRTPPLRFLPRTHVFNRIIGRLRHRALQYIPRRKWIHAGEHVTVSGPAQTMGPAT
jgi:tetratricopeptide (TPR) repeat protein